MLYRNAFLSIHLLLNPIGKKCLFPFGGFFFPIPNVVDELVPKGSVQFRTAIVEYGLAETALQIKNVRVLFMSTTHSEYREE